MFVILYVYLRFFFKGTTIALTLYFSWTVEVSSIFFRFQTGGQQYLFEYCVNTLPLKHEHKNSIIKMINPLAKNKFRACRVESTREDYSLVESLCQGGGMTQHFIEHLPFYTLSDTVKKLIGLQYQANINIFIYYKTLFLDLKMFFLWIMQMISLVIFSKFDFKIKKTLFLRRKIGCAF